jgi:catechol 2,3-dioxygenase-like lactoylglutathione lyase family enzyme
LLLFGAKLLQPIKGDLMVKPRFGFVLEYVRDIEAAKRFYTEVLGLQMERYHPTFIQFGHSAVANDESMTGNRDPELYWLVDDAEAAFLELRERADVSLPLKHMPFGKVFGIKNPDGRPCYVLELARDRPSQAVQ